MRQRTIINYVITELGLNGICFVGKRSGVGRYITYLIKCWEFVEHPFDKIKVYTLRPVDIKMPNGINNVVIPTHVPTSTGSKY